ncbi:hypothetical protein SteCoe_32295 [Stentor coeruleus]|uniref:ZZ-type domain-containing protein n=1 Tax=Stentor coeruleus TaxID=5963 RepID=A0A1R2AZB4_9CILI|nr:hypothetical protein SteCoe_32295 [Stentor coeruleus]
MSYNTFQRPMSSNTTPSLKLQLGNELRKISKAPETIKELRSIVLTLFSRDNFQITYQDEEGDFISISTDFELKNLLDKNKNKPSLKLNLKDSVEESVYDRIENLRQSLMQNINSESLSTPEILSTNSRNSIKSVESLSESSSSQEKPLIIETKPEIKEEAKIQPVEPVKDKTKAKKAQKKPKEKKENKAKKPKKPLKSKSSKNIDLVIHQNIICDGCNIGPIVGIRYKCTTCHDFDLCENCEEKSNHAHPLIKIKVPMNIEAKPFWAQHCPMPGPSAFVHGNEGMINHIKEFMKGHVKDIIKKKYKVKVCAQKFPNNFAVVPGGLMKLVWEVKNKGKIMWPEGSKLVMIRGNFICEDVVLRKIEPGEKVLIEVQTRLPYSEGLCKGTWQIDTGSRKFGKIQTRLPYSEGLCKGTWQIDTGSRKFGKIKACIKSVIDEKVRTLANMGFSTEKAKAALDNANGDLSLAVSQILNH